MKTQFITTEEAEKAAKAYSSDLSTTCGVEYGIELSNKKYESEVLPVLEKLKKEIENVMICSNFDQAKRLYSDTSEHHWTLRLESTLEQLNTLLK